MALSCDVESAAFRHVQFLRSVHIALAEPRAEVYVEALRRYLTLWLPFIAKHKDKIDLLVPPADIAFFWHCHRLDAENYAIDCIQRCGSVIKPSFDCTCQCQMDMEVANVVSGAANMYIDAASYTQTLWNKEFCTLYKMQPMESFFMEPKNLATVLKTFKLVQHPTKSKILSIVKAQRNYYYHVGREGCDLPEFMETAKERYLKFLKLLRLGGSLSAIPCYDIDLMWRTHMLHRDAYCQDTKAIVGSVPPFWHAAWLTAEPDFTNEALLEAFQKTRGLYEAVYRESYVSKAVVPNGPPPDAFWKIRFPTQLEKDWTDVLKRLPWREGFDLRYPASSVSLSLVVLLIAFVVYFLYSRGLLSV